MERICERHGAEAQFALGKIYVNEVLDIIFNKSENMLRRQTYCDFIEAIFEKNMGSLSFPVSYAMIFLIVILILGILIKTKTQIYDKFSMIALGITCICGTLGYAFTMLISYLFCYSEGEMMKLASFERYMSSYVIGELLIITSILLLTLAERELVSARKLMVSSILVAGWINLQNLEVFVPGMLIERPNQQYIAIAERLESVIEGEEQVFIISHSTIELQYYVNCYSQDLDIVLCYSNVLNFDTENEELINYIQDIVFTKDYLYFHEISEEFNSAFAKLNGNNNFETGNLYKISENGIVCIVE